MPEVLNLLVDSSDHPVKCRAGQQLYVVDKSALNPCRDASKETYPCSQVNLLLISVKSWPPRLLLSV
jgi:hypothetical protein